MFAYRPQYLVIGRHVDLEECIGPRKLSLDFSHLAQWFGNRSLDEIVDRLGRPAIAPMDLPISESFQMGDFEL